MWTSTPTNCYRVTTENHTHVYDSTKWKWHHKQAPEIKTPHLESPYMPILFAWPREFKQKIWMCCHSKIYHFTAHLISNTNHIICRTQIKNILNLQLIWAPSIQGTSQSEYIVTVKDCVFSSQNSNASYMLY